MSADATLPLDVDVREEPPCSFRSVRTLAAVTSLDWRHVQAARWSRQLATAALASFRRLTEGQVFFVSRMVDVREENPAELVRYIPPLRRWLSPTPIIGDELARAELAADLVVLCAALGQLTGTWSLRVRLGVVDHDACAKLHTDRVTLRAVCTYAGPGTEVLPDPYVDRAALMQAAAEGWGPVETDRAVCLEPEAMVRPAPGDVMWLRGRCYPGALTPAAVHRSPAHAADRRRLVLTIDAG